MKFVSAFIMACWLAASTLAIVADVHASVDTMPCHEMGETTAHGDHSMPMPEPMQHGTMHHEHSDNSDHEHEAPCDGTCCDGACLCTMMCSAYSSYALTGFSILTTDKVSELYTFANLRARSYTENLTDPPPRSLS